MGKLNITPEDLLRSKVVKPNWYRAIVKRVGEKPAKSDGSTNHVVDFIITAEGDYKGVPLTNYFSEKAPGFAIKFIDACGGTIGPQGGTYDMERAEGKSLDLFIDNDMYEGRMTNKIKDYRKATT